MRCKHLFTYLISDRHSLIFNHISSALLSCPVICAADETITAGIPPFITYSPVFILKMLTALLQMKQKNQVTVKEDYV
jgi:hypothetical protein